MLYNLFNSRALSWAYKVDALQTSICWLHVLKHQNPTGASRVCAELYALRFSGSVLSKVMPCAQLIALPTAVGCAFAW